MSHRIDEGTVENVRAYVDWLRHASSADRDLIRTIVERGIALGGRRETQLGIDVHQDDLKTIRVDNRPLSDYRIGKLGRTLDRNNLGGLDADAEPRLQIAAPDEDLDWSTLESLLKADGRTLRDLICDLGFGLLA